MCFEAIPEVIGVGLGDSAGPRLPLFRTGSGGSSRSPRVKMLR